MAGNKSNLIYVLICPVTGRLRYIGKTCNPRLRVWQHENEAAKRRHKFKRLTWLRSLAEAGERPIFRRLFVVPPGMDWQCVERFFIASAKHLGFDLVNGTSGGEGIPDISAEARARSVAAKKALWNSPEGRAMYLGASQSVTARAKRSVSCRATRNTEESKRKASEHSRALWSQPEYKQRKSAATLAAWAVNRDARSARIAEGAKTAWSDPERRAARVAKLRAHYVGNAEWSAKMKQVWKRRKEGMNAT